MLGFFFIIPFTYLGFEIDMPNISNVQGKKREEKSSVIQITNKLSKKL